MVEDVADVGDADGVWPVAGPVGLRVELQDAAGAVVDGDRVARMVDAHDDVAVAGQVASLRGVERGGGAAAGQSRCTGVLAARGGRAAGRRAGDAVEGSGGELVGDLDVGLLGAGQDVGRAGASPRRRVPDAQREPARPAARDGEPFGAVMVGQRETLKTNRRSAGRGRRGDGGVRGGRREERPRGQDGDCEESHEGRRPWVRRRRS